ncbi:hypothetical protein [Candidatus Entotheonella palauensis]|uniref:hypothetical protein n=1 Tax=Candidatus Entotheonella palauensis TaxID=93172 RepID=UPI000B80131C|nr:hypothetical protein [Candidatus Entotheonella palauensis]
MVNISGARPPKRTQAISKQDMQDAEAFLQNTPMGRCLQAAEHILTLFAANRLPRVRQMMFYTGYDLREITGEPQRESSG